MRLIFSQIILTIILLVNHSIDKTNEPTRKTKVKTLAYKGNASVQFNLVVMYQQGKGVKKDQAIGDYWIRQSGKS